MKITIEGKPDELKKLLDAIGSSKEQSKAVVPADKIKKFKPTPYSYLYQACRGGEFQIVEIPRKE